MIGRRLGPHEVTGKLGEGGMGEVWRASDTRLGRDVAIKVLSKAFVADADRVARFDREARVLASLSHANIAGLHDVGEQDGTHFLVMELAPGETLAERIARGPLPVEEAVDIAGQIAEAVSAAHEQGIVHRDLKPGNVMVAPDGSVKVLDFGLAKALTPEGASGSSPELSLSPTMTFQATAVGVLLGTAAYMSPEQAKGRQVDRRSDVWAFGCVLFEMLAGKAAFAGDTIAEILASILRSEPDWEALPASLPPDILTVLGYCLSRDPKERLRDVADARLLLEQAIAAPPQEQMAKPTRGRERFAWMLASVALLAAVGLGLRKEVPETDRPLIRFSVTLPEDQELALIDQPILAFSPDARSIAWVAKSSSTETSRLHLRSLDDTEPVALAGTDGASEPFFSPDGEWLAFFAGGRLKKIPIGGGTAVSLADAENPRGAAWAADDMIIYSPLYTSGLWSVPAAGGTAKEILAPNDDAGERTYRWPAIFPDGRSILFTVGSTSSPNDYDEARIVVWDPDSGERSTLVEGASMARLLGDDRLLFYRNNSLFAANLDVEARSLVGAPTPVLEGVLGDPTSGAAYFSVAGDGSLAFVRGSTADETSRLRLFDVHGESRLLELEPRAFHHPTFSPDGSQLAFMLSESQSGASGDIWTYSLATKTLSRLTFDETGVRPVWSPGGDEIAYFDTGESALLAKSADGSGTRRAFTSSGLTKVLLPGAWSPDGKTVAYTLLDRETELYLVEEGEEPRFFERDASLPAFSPDGRWLAYSQPASGNSVVYVRPVQGEGKWQVSPGVGGYPRWPARASAIYFLGIRETGRPLLAVDLEEGDGLRFGPPRVVIPDTTRLTTSTAPIANWDVSSDGRQFVFVEPLREESAGSEFQVILDWGRHLKLLDEKRAP